VTATTAQRALLSVEEGQAFIRRGTGNTVYLVISDGRTWTLKYRNACEGGRR
jgi:hypothetical protein